MTESGQMQPIVLYSYRGALDHVMSSHMMTNQNKKDKKLNYELELFEQVNCLACDLELKCSYNDI